MESERPRVGWKVKTVLGVGFISGVMDWRKALKTLTDDEGTSFVRLVKFRFGSDWRSHWYRVMVGGQWYDFADIEVLSVERQIEDGGAERAGIGDSGEDQGEVDGEGGEAGQAPGQ